MKQFSSKSEIIYDLIRREGGYVNDPADAGGETKYGISKRSYPNLDIANLTKQEAYSIFERDYWNNGIGNFWKLDTLNSWIRPLLFDMNVHHGGMGATTILQRALRKRLKIDLSIDGIFGSETFNCISIATERADNPYEKLTPDSVISALVEERITYLMQIIYRKCQRR